MHKPDTKKFNPPIVNNVTAVLYKSGSVSVFLNIIVPIK